MSSPLEKFPVSWPHRARPHMGRFRRAWVVAELTEDNCDHSGVLYRDDEGRVVYATIVRLEQNGLTSWKISRHVHRDGRLRDAGPGERHPTRPGAIRALMAEARSSLERFGPVPGEEWPEDADSPWIVFSTGRRSGSHSITGQEES